MSINTIHVCVFICVTVALNLASCQHHNLPLYDQSTGDYDHPNTDVQKAIQSNDLRFVVIKANDMVIPECGKFTNYPHKIIVEKSGYNLSNTLLYEYALTYNSYLSSYLNETRALQIAQMLSSYDTITQDFSLVSAHIGYTSTLPCALSLRLRSRSNRIVDTVEWYNPTSNEVPQYKWDDLRAMLRGVESVAGNHSWIVKWKASVTNRHVETRMFGMTSNDEEYTNPSCYLDDYVLPAWRHAKLQGRPSYRIVLRRGGDFCANVYLSDDDHRALITKCYKGDGAHWLDKLSCFYDPSENVPNYIVVEPDGQWRTNIVRGRAESEMNATNSSSQSQP